MVPEPTELLLIGYSIESIWTPKSKSNALTPKTQLADILTKGNFTRDEWNYLLCFFDISHFSSIKCSEVMSKWTREDAGEERVTAKSRPMMSLIARAPSALSSTASESLGETRHDSQLPLSSWNEQRLRTERLVEDACSSRYSEWNADEKWSSQEWKSDEVMEVRTVRLVNEQPPGLFAQITRTNLLLKTMIWTLTPTQNQTCPYYPDHSCTGWMVECERFKTNPQKMQHKTATNIL